MNIVCRVCRTWILQRRIQAQMPHLERVVFAWSHDAVLARTLVAQAAHATGTRVELFRSDTDLRVALYQKLLQVYRRYQRDYREVLNFVPAEQMSAASTPMVHRVRRAMQKLEEQQRLLVSLVDLGGCSYTETAQILNLAHAELLDLLCNARAQLKTQLLNHQASAAIGARHRQWGAQ